MWTLSDRLSNESDMSHASSARRRRAELVRIKLKFADEEIAWKKAHTEVKYKHPLIPMDLVLLATKMADEVATCELAKENEVEAPVDMPIV